MKANHLKYLAVLTGPFFAYISFTYTGLWTFALPLYAFGLIPILDMFFKGDTQNMTEVEEYMAKKDPIYDWLLWMIVPMQYGILLYFLYSVSQPNLTWFEISGRILSMGIACTTFGINVGHELGHRATKHEQTMSKALYLTTLYMHFFIEHNRGHHKRVATPEDPASSRYGEIVYTFWLRSVVGGYTSAWQLETERLKRRDLAFLSVHNEMIWYHVIQLAFVALIAMVFGLPVMGYFLAAAFIGFSYLEIINYIEHYGLTRKKIGENRYEKVLPIHSWNCNYTVGRIMLFELTRHSDHHYRASRKYQILRHHENTPMLPYGYPTMILISLVPPLWFKIMHQRIADFKAANPIIGKELVHG